VEQVLDITSMVPQQIGEELARRFQQTEEGNGFVLRGGKGQEEILRRIGELFPEIFVYSEIARSGEQWSARVERGARMRKKKGQALVGVIDRFHVQLNQDLTRLLKAAEAEDWAEVWSLVQKLEEELMLHFQFEEEALFPVLERHVSEEDGPVWRLVAEHRESLKTLQHLSSMIVRMAYSDAPKVAIILSCQTLRRMLSNHNEAEERILEAFFEARFTEEERTEILQRARIAS